MKPIFIYLLLSILSLVCRSQGSFALQSSVGTIEVSVNGHVYAIDSVSSAIRTHYPAFDTLVLQFNASESRSQIICNFKPDSSYTIISACCGSLDIIPTSKLNHDSLELWDSFEDFDKIQAQLMDRPFISIRSKEPTKDAVYAWHADAACLTEHRIIHTELWRLGIPPKCNYWNNITTIMFFKQDDQMSPHEQTSLEELLDIENIVELAEIRFRLFDDERFVLEFDDETNAVTITYE